MLVQKLEFYSYVLVTQLLSGVVIALPIVLETYSILMAFKFKTPMMEIFMFALATSKANYPPSFALVMENALLDTSITLSVVGTALLQNASDSQLMEFFA